MAAETIIHMQVVRMGVPGSDLKIMEMSGHVQEGGLEWEVGQIISFFTYLFLLIF